MKKILLMLCSTALILSLLAGCAPQRPNNTTETPLAAELRKVTVSKPTVDLKYEDEFTEAYYIDSPLAHEYSVYATAYAEGDSASAAFLDRWESCEDVRYYPVLGENFEYTRLFLIVFFENDAPVKSFTLEVSENASSYTVGDFSFRHYAREDYKNGKIFAVGPFSNHVVLGDLKELWKYRGQVNLEGVVFNTRGYDMPYPIGCDANQSQLQYWRNCQWNEFGLVNGFSGVEEGRTAFDNYYAEKEKVLTSIPVYEVKKDDQSTAYFQRFIQNNRTGVLKDYEYHAEISLLDENGEKNGYTLFLLYYHNILIGEIVIRHTAEAEEEIWRREAVKDSQTNAYIPLENSYTKAIKQAKSDGKIDVKGVMFNQGCFLPIGFDADDRVCVYNALEKSLQYADEYMNK